ncbi:MAG: hypothetical protein J7463_16085 [Roseiflexus sp.]|nr:hypothetical protein [Roseiflexus sp.]
MALSAPHERVKRGWSQVVHPRWQQLKTHRYAFRSTDPNPGGVHRLFLTAMFGVAAVMAPGVLPGDDWQSR